MTAAPQQVVANNSTTFSTSTTTTASDASYSTALRPANPSLGLNRPSGSNPSRLFRHRSHQELRSSQDVSRPSLKPSEFADGENSHHLISLKVSSSYSASSVAESIISASTSKHSTSPASQTSTWSRASSRDRDSATPSSGFSNITLTAESAVQQTGQRQVSAAVRRPSPGLAARLKALGFSTSKKPALDPTIQSDNIGRLDERQLRQLDEKHLASSFTSVIARRGRPWRGAGASSNLRSTSQPNLPTILVAEESPRLPEIVTPEPLVMDTQKYRLPDHINGNGTKVTIDTRREHLERQALHRSSSNVSATPPIPPEKDTPPAVETPPVESQSTDYVPGLSSYFTSSHNRPGSIYTLSRASFANQLAQLTSLQLPDAESLSSKVSAIPTAHAAAKALINAADQIRSWISKAQEVIGGLDSEDDVEWAAAGGREGLEDVEGAITRFQELIKAYVSAIEELQGREDVCQVATEDLKRAVSQMEIIVDEWSKIRATLQSVRAQVEIAMEWEELWNNVLGDIQGEMDELIRLVFEMEERRHKTLTASGGDNVDIGDLETVIEEPSVSSPHLKAPNRFSMPVLPASPSSPAGPATPILSQDDSSLLALFARMQPLRASLDFLPMRLSVFETRAEQSFPTACEELEMRRAGLDANYKKLEKDAESLRKELGEDRWVIVFRGAGRQAQKMQESVERSALKLREAIDTSLHQINPPAMSKKIESYEAKKLHYGPAIERVLSIIDRGVKDRLTVNGEILRLHSETQSRWSVLKEQMKELDTVVEDMLVENKSRQLRDSVSSMLSNDRSTLGSAHETPGSSPPSSVIMSSLGFDPHTPFSNKHKSRSPGGPSSSGRRQSLIPAPASALANRSSRLSTIPSSSAGTPVPGSRIQRPGSTLDHRPRWNTSTNTNDLQVGFSSFKPSTLTTPSPYSKNSPSGQRAAAAVTPTTTSKLPISLGDRTRGVSASPKVEESPSRRSNSRLSFRERLTSPGPYSQQTLSKQRAKNSTTTRMNRCTSMQPMSSSLTVDADLTSRPASSLASARSRRSSLLSPPKSKDPVAGRDSPQLSSSRLALRKEQGNAEAKDANKPKWRY